MPQNAINNLKSVAIALKELSVGPIISIIHDMIIVVTGEIISLTKVRW